MLYSLAIARASLTVRSNCECFHCHMHFQNENDTANFDLSYFNGKEVYIDLARKHKHLEPMLKKALTKTGATIEYFFSKDVDCIITDRLHRVTSAWASPKQFYSYQDQHGKRIRNNKYFVGSTEIQNTCHPTSINQTAFRIASNRSFIYYTSSCYG